MMEVEKWSPLFVGLFWTRGIKWEVAQGRLLGAGNGSIPWSR